MEIDIEKKGAELAQEIFAEFQADAGTVWDKFTEEQAGAVQTCSVHIGRVIAREIVGGPPLSAMEAASYRGALAGLESAKIAGALTARTLFINTSLKVLERTLAAVGSAVKGLLAGA